MPVHLLDANVLLALMWRDHEHHEMVHEWFKENADGGRATCALTQCAFVRLSSNPKFAKEPLPTSEAVDFLETLLARPGHQFWINNINLTDGAYVQCDRLRGHRQVADACLAGLAIRHDGGLVTLDRGIKTLLPAKEQHRIVILQP